MIRKYMDWVGDDNIETLHNLLIFKHIHIQTEATKVGSYFNITYTAAPQPTQSPRLRRLK